VSSKASLNFPSRLVRSVAAMAISLGFPGRHD
jgi:hypothetical protein